MIVSKVLYWNSKNYYFQLSTRSKSSDVIKKRRNKFGVQLFIRDFSLYACKIKRVIFVGSCFSLHLRSSSLSLAAHICRVRGQEQPCITDVASIM